jgi:hypothetical protein
MTMSHYKENVEEQKTRIMEQTAELSRLLGMVPTDDTIDVQDPLTHDLMALSDWLSETRDAFLTLSTSISKALDIQLQ